MAKEAYVSFEIAEKLKEKGFDEKCNFVFNKNSHGLLPCNWPTTNSEIENKDIIALPTQQMACAWLREKHEMHIMVNCEGKTDYDPIIQCFDGRDFEIEGKVVGITKVINGELVNVRRGFKTPEEAVDAALKYALEELI